MRYAVRPDGRPDTIRDPGNHTTVFRYSSTGHQNLDSVIVGPRIFRYAYDDFGRTSKTVNAERDSSLMLYDIRNRITRVIGPINDTTTYSYDSLYLRKVTDALGNEYEFAQNGMGLDTAHVDAAGAIQRYVYDLNGNVARWINRRGDTISYTYDTLDRLIERDAAGAVTIHTRDNIDSLYIVSNGTSLDSLHYDGAGRLFRASAVRPPLTRKFALRPQYMGNDGPMWSLSLDTSNSQIRSQWWTYNPGGELVSTTIYGASVALVSFGYDKELLVDSTAYPMFGPTTWKLLTYPSSHVESSINYSQADLDSVAGRYIKQDSLGRTIEAWYSPIDTFRIYNYDAAGRMWRMYLNRATSTAGSCSSSGDFGFDCPTTDTLNVRTFLYTYDKLGNSTTGTIDPGNRARQVETEFTNPLGGPPLIVDTLTYDADGNVTERRAGTVRQVFVWNALSQLDSVRTYVNGSLQNTSWSKYDGFDRRVWSGVGADSTGYIWFGDVIIAETNDTMRLTASYSYLPGRLQPFSMIRGSSNYFYMYDEANNVTALLNEDLTVTNRYRYDPFGFPSAVVEGVTNSIKFAGQMHDYSTALVYMRNRYYDFRTRRFISEDPVRFKNGANAYVYAGNDPINQHDPLGLWCEKRIRSGVEVLHCEDIGPGDFFTARNYLGGDAGEFAFDFFQSMGWTSWGGGACRGGFDPGQCSDIAESLSKLTLHQDRKCSTLGVGATMRFQAGRFELKQNPGYLGYAQKFLPWGKIKLSSELWGLYSGQLTSTIAHEARHFQSPFAGGGLLGITHGEGDSVYQLGEYCGA